MTARSKDGGPAFPIVAAEGEYLREDGMTLRDYFAAAALTGLIAADTDYLENEEEQARGAYKMADAMLKRREAQP